MIDPLFGLFVFFVHLVVAARVQVSGECREKGGCDLHPDPLASPAYADATTDGFIVEITSLSTEALAKARDALF